ncbi:MAG TPA: hypothetical protein VIG69_16030 [Candidatus Methylomirabilis sp.]
MTVARRWNSSRRSVSPRRDPSIPAASRAAAAPAGASPVPGATRAWRSIFRRRPKAARTTASTAGHSAGGTGGTAWGVSATTAEATAGRG